MAEQTQNIKRENDTQTPAKGSGGRKSIAELLKEREAKRIVKR